MKKYDDEEISNGGRMCKCGNSGSMEFLWRWYNTEIDEECFDVWGCSKCGLLLKDYFNCGKKDKWIEI